MRLLKSLGVMFLGVCAVGVLVVSSASAALPVVLSNPTQENGQAKAVGTEAVFETTGKKNVKCKTTSGTSTQSGTTSLGKFHIEFKECTTVAAGITFKCSGLGDATGIILTLGEYHLVEDTLGESEKNSLGVAILFLLEPTHFECAGGFALVKVTGNELCLIVEPHVFKTLHELVCSQTSGVPTDKTYWNDEEKEVHQGLKESEAEGTEVGSAESAKALLLWLNPTGTANVEVSIMG